jgi:hypothetical protein
MGLFLPYQVRWYADKARLRVGEKARRVGLTWAEGARQVMTAASARSAGGSDCYYVSTSYLLGREYIEMCGDWARMLNVVTTHYGTRVLRDGNRDVLTHEIRFSSGHSVFAVTSNPAAFRGRGGSVCIDEAAHHPNLPELLKAAAAVGDWGGDLSRDLDAQRRRQPVQRAVRAAPDAVAGRVAAPCDPRGRAGRGPVQEAVRAARRALVAWSSRRSGSRRSWRHGARTRSTRSSPARAGACTSAAI